MATTQNETDHSTEEQTGTQATERGSAPSVDEAVQGLDAKDHDGRAADPGAAEAKSADAPAAAEPASGLREEYERLRTERDTLVDRLARLQAEFDNARKREQRERADYRAFAVADAVEQFLPVLDNFKLALTSGGTAEQMRVGVELIAKQMEEVLRSLNVTPVEAVGAAFDPRVHEALESVEREGVPDHQVIEEVRRGYRIKERLLRPALVRIAVNAHPVAEA